MKNIFKKIVTSVLILTTFAQSAVAVAAPYGLMSLGAIPSQNISSNDLMNLTDITNLSTTYGLMNVADDPATATTRRSASEKSKLMTEKNQSVIKNNISSIISGVAGTEARNNVFDLSTTTPIIWGRYLPEAKKGAIQITYIRKKGHTNELGVAPEIAGSLTPTEFENTLKKFYDLKVEHLSPEDGKVFALKGSANGFRGENPFKEFTKNRTYEKGIPLNIVPEDVNQYHDISFPAFATIVGMWAQHYSTQRGFIAIGNTKVDHQKWEKCNGFWCITKTYHQEATAATKPLWYVLTSANNAEQRALNSGFKIQNCTLQTPVYKGSSQVLKDAECAATSGVSFVPVSSFSDLPVDYQTMWHVHHSTTGLNLLLVFFVSALIMIWTGYYMDPFSLAAAQEATAVLTFGVVLVDMLDDYNSTNSTSLNPNIAILTCNSGPECFGRDKWNATNSANGQSIDWKWDPSACLLAGKGDHLISGYADHSTSSDPDTRFGCIEGSLCPVTKFACINWLSSKLDDPGTPVSLRNMFESRSHKLTKDIVNVNEIERIKENGSKPQAFGANPSRQ